MITKRKPMTKMTKYEATLAVHLIAIDCLQQDVINRNTLNSVMDKTKIGKLWREQTEDLKVARDYFIAKLPKKIPGWLVDQYDSPQGGVLRADLEEMGFKLT